MESPGSTIIFCRTRREVDELGEALQMRGYEAETLHGEMNQAARDRVMNRFRASQADLLIATDVAARGLDIDQVTHVINYDIPWDVESYIHRIGRTGPRRTQRRRDHAHQPARAPSAASRSSATSMRRSGRPAFPPPPTSPPAAAKCSRTNCAKRCTSGNFDGYLVTRRGAGRRGRVRRVADRRRRPADAVAGAKRRGRLRCRRGRRGGGAHRSRA